MNVTIDKSIFDCYGTRDVDKQLFSKVLHTAQYRCHTVSLSQSCEMEDIYKLDSNDAFFLQEFFNDFINSSRETRLSDCLLKVGGESEDNNKVFGLDEVYDYISSPAVIIVENGKNDGFLIRAIEEHFDHQLNFEDLLKKSIIIIDNSGGSGDRNRVEYYLDLHSGKKKYLHCCVIVDGDKKFPKDTQKEDQHKEYFEMYDNLGVKYHVWEKRAMENYMPDEVFIANRNTWGRLWVDAYLNLKPEQKDYYNIASGFSADMIAGHPEDYTSLPKGMDNQFNDVHPTNFHRLVCPPRITPAPYNTPISLRKKGCTMKESFPTYFRTAEVRYNTLINRTSHQNDPDELLHVAQMIRQII